MRRKIVEKILKDNGINTTNLKRDKIGKNYYVYLTDEFVVKIPKSKLSKKIYKKEFGFYQNFKLPFIPEFVATGQEKKYKYLIIKRIQGKPLIDEFPNLTTEQVLGYFEQICEYLNQIANLDYKEYAMANNFLLDNVTLAYQEYLSEVVDRFKKLKINTTKLEYIKDKVVEIIFRESKPILLYNDFHFGNFIVNKTKLFFLDFDYNTCQPIDYFYHSIKVTFKFAKKCISKDKIEDGLEDKFLAIFLNRFKDEIDERYFEQRQKFYDFCFDVNQVYLKKRLFKKHPYKKILKTLEDYFFIDK